MQMHTTDKFNRNSGLDGLLYGEKYQESWQRKHKAEVRDKYSTENNMLKLCVMIDCPTLPLPFVIILHSSY